MRLARGHWVKAACRTDIRGEQTVALQKVGQSEQAEARAGLLQKVTAISELLVTSAVVAHSNLLSVCEVSGNCLALSSPFVLVVLVIEPRHSIEDEDDNEDEKFARTAKILRDSSTDADELTRISRINAKALFAKMFSGHPSPFRLTRRGTAGSPFHATTRSIQAGTDPA